LVATATGFEVGAVGVREGQLRESVTADWEGENREVRVEELGFLYICGWMDL
jgi:hypothetical protein